MSWVGLGLVIALSIFCTVAGALARRSRSFYYRLVSHAEAQRRLHRLPPATPYSYERDRRTVATVLSGLGVLLATAATYMVMSNLVSA